MMKVAFVKNKKILSIASTAVKPEGNDWIVLADDFKGKVGDGVSSNGAVVYAADGLSANEALKIVQDAQQELADAEKLYRKANEDYDTAEKAAKVAVLQATDATNARNAAYASLVEAERKWKKLSREILDKKEQAKRIVDAEVERAGEEAAKKAKEEAKKTAKKNIEKNALTKPV
jgi:hypothetical protein